MGNLDPKDVERAVNWKTNQAERIAASQSSTVVTMIPPTDSVVIYTAKANDPDLIEIIEEYCSNQEASGITTLPEPIQDIVQIPDPQCLLLTFHDYHGNI